MTSSSSKSDSAKQVSKNPQPHVFETFRFSEDYEAFWRQVILLTICGSHDCQYISYSDKPALPLPVSFSPSWLSIKSVYKLILETDINCPIISHLLIVLTTLLVNPPLFRSLGALPPVAISARTFQDALFWMTRWHIRRVI
jgi:hypothetical protein